MQALNIIFGMRDSTSWCDLFGLYCDFTARLLSMACVALCSSWDSQDQFDTKVYGIVIQSLVEEPGPLPTLFMRTVIQVVCSPGPRKQKAEANATWNEYEG